jgi:hypothetical protein
VKLLLLLPFILSSCAFGPGVYYGKSGISYAHTGGSFIASRKEVMAKVTTKAGDTIEYMSKGEEADDVALAAASAYGAGILSKHTASVDKAKVAGETSRHAATQSTKQAATAAKAGVATEAIKAAPDKIGTIPIPVIK